MFLLLFCILLASKGADSVRTLNVHIPEIPPFYLPTTDGKQNQGLIEDFLQQSIDEQINFNIQSYSTAWEFPDLEATKCIDQVNQSDLCLIRFDQSLLKSLQNKSILFTSNTKWPYMSRTFLDAPITIIMPCTGSECPWHIDSSVMSAMYFLNAFHSSVWSLIFLYILTTGSLLFLFEYTHPFRIGIGKYLGRCEGRLTLLESLLYVTYAIFLSSIHKGPKSWAGLVLTIFWHAFCILCLIAYLLGTAELILKPVNEYEFHHTRFVNLKPNATIACALDADWCMKLAQQTNYSIQMVDTIAKQSDLLLHSNHNETMPLVTDQLTVQYLLSQNPSFRHWAVAKIDCPDELKNYGRAKLELAFLTQSPESNFWMNDYLQNLEHNGNLSKLQNKWISKRMPSGICYDSNAGNFNHIPIRLKQMNGPLLFMIVGASIAIITHLCEFVYFSFIREETKVHLLKSHHSKPNEGLSRLVA